MNYCMLTQMAFYSQNACVCLYGWMSRWTPTQSVRRILKAVATMPSTACQIDKAKWFHASACVRFICLCIFQFKFFLRGRLLKPPLLSAPPSSASAQIILDFSKFIFSLYHAEPMKPPQHTRTQNEMKGKFKWNEFFAMHIFISLSFPNFHSSSSTSS